MTNNTTAPALTDEQIDAIYDAVPWQDLNVNSLDHAKILRRRFARALLTSPRAAVPADRRKDFETAMAAIPVEDGNPTSFIRDGDDSYVQHHVESAWLGFSLACQMLDASPAAPVDEYDGNHVQNHCPECNEHEAECSCAQAVAADGAATKDDVDALTFALGASVMIEGGEKYREALKRMLDRERAAVSPATAVTPLNGIAATMFHGEGAIARCSYCGRYSLDPKTLGDRQPKCECGEKHGWSGSFEKPGPDAKWSGAAPSGMPATADERAPQVKFSQFLTDVITAAGLLQHGRTDKKLAARIGEMAFSMLGSSPSQAVAPAEPTDYAAIEREHFGDPDKRTGIYAPATADERAALTFDEWRSTYADAMSASDATLAWSAARASQAAAPADAREPDAYMTLDCVSLKPASVYLNREDVADMRPDHVVPLYRGGAPADAGEAVLTAAARDVLAERARQMEKEGYSFEHDDSHEDGEMALAAGCYASNAGGVVWGRPVPSSFPWSPYWWKPTTPRRDCVKAAALLIAEIERIDRAEARTAGAQGGKGGEA
ncbi:hypothetical protein [Burkholderia glumae]|uniref:hypothetical protein n=1 Tax=Burkholderia glumae TaxID=337 RepID=UPI00214F894B|nr:hypothetical protein [Burkholderia glumae]